MKKLFIGLLVIAQYQVLTAQSVGIGTATPNTSAQLDVTSTNKGLLIPRMTGAQRTAIATPAIGLMVIQTNTETVPPSSPGLYLCEQVGAFPVWRRIARTDEITSGTSTWTVNGSNQYSNVAGNVGIGTTLPTSKFHLAGDFLQESGAMTINNPSAIIRVQNAGVDKASIYLSGDNFRIGTNSGNTLGSVYLQSNGTIRLTASPGGNVGIGTTSPTEKLHVIGNILSTNRIDANGVIEGNGVSSTGTLYVNGTSLLQGAVTGNSTATFGSTITSNASMVVNDPSAIIQLQNGGVNKGFVQLSGENLRFGTNSGNTTGNVVVRMNGNDRITINPAGDINTEGKITTSVTGNSNLLPICYGRVVTETSTPGVFGTSNITVTKIQTGIYDIFCPSFGNLTVIVGSVTSLRSNIEHVFNSRYMGFGTNTYRVRLTPISGSPADEDFSFVAYNHTQ